MQQIKAENFPTSDDYFDQSSEATIKNADQLSIAYENTYQPYPEEDAANMQANLADITLDGIDESWLDPEMIESLQNDESAIDIEEPIVDYAENATEQQVYTNNAPWFSNPPLIHMPTEDMDEDGAVDETVSPNRSNITVRL